MKSHPRNPLLLLLAAVAVTGPLAAQTRTPEPAKEPAKKESPKADAREVAKKAANFEAAHRDRMARIERLIAIYTAKGDRAKVAELEALRDSQTKRHANAMAGFRKQLGPDAWGRLEKEMKGAKPERSKEKPPPPPERKK